MKRITFLNYPVDQMTMVEALSWIKTKSKSHFPHVITVINANKMWLANKNRRLKKILCFSDLVIPEYAVVWGAKKLHLPSLCPIYGVVLTKTFLSFAAKENLRPFFLGAQKHVLDTMLEIIKTNYPSLKVAGAHHGYINGPDIEATVIKSIQSSNPDILFVAMGSPFQEFWIDSNKEKLGVPVLIGVGGSFDVLAGVKHDTPNWIRGTGLEWVYRLLLEPKRYWKRYFITNPWFVWKVVKNKYKIFEKI